MRVGCVTDDRLLALVRLFKSLGRLLLILGNPSEDGLGVARPADLLLLAADEYPELGVEVLLARSEGHLGG